MESTLPSSSPRVVTELALGAWFATTTVGLAYLLGAHVAALPTPDATDPALQAAIAARHAPDRPLVLHVLAEECACSGRVLAQLETRTPRDDVDERVILVDAAAGHAAVIARYGFVVEEIAGDELAARFGVPAVPTLVATRADGSVAYVGGYTERKQGARIETDDILDEVLAGGAPAALPVLGCAVSSSLAQAADPWGLR